jgi:hypothetical protein
MPLRGGLKYEFSRHGEIFPSDGAQTLGSNAPAHRLDESPVGYSLSGWSPPVPGSASPTRTSILQNGPETRKIFIAGDFRFWGRNRRNSSVTFLVEATRPERLVDARQQTTFPKKWPRPSLGGITEAKPLRCVSY